MSITMQQPLIYAVLVQWRSCADTFPCLESLFAAGYPNLRVALVDNGTPEGCRGELRARFPAVELLENGRNLGFTGANNRGMAHALARGAAYVLLLNNDTLVEPGFLDPLLAALAADERAGLAAPKILFADEPARLWYAGARRTWLYGGPDNLSHRGFGAPDAGQYDQPGPVGFASGCAMLLRRALIERVGMFDDDYFAYFEDMDLCVRARRAGFRLLYVPAARIWHRAAHSTTGRANYSPRGVYFATRNALLFMRKQRRPWQWLIFLPLFAPRLARRWATYMIQRQPMATAAMVAGIADFLRGRLGPGQIERFSRPPA